MPRRNFSVDAETDQVLCRAVADGRMPSKSAAVREGVQLLDAAQGTSTLQLKTPPIRRENVQLHEAGKEWYCPTNDTVLCACGTRVKWATSTVDELLNSAPSNFPMEFGLPGPIENSLRLHCPSCRRFIELAVRVERSGWTPAQLKKLDEVWARLRAGGPSTLTRVKARVGEPVLRSGGLAWLATDDADAWLFQINYQPNVTEATKRWHRPVVSAGTSGGVDAGLLALEEVVRDA
jgi:Arc/MetJ-type ribon-helix-helix transcriptional regulator